MSSSKRSRLVAIGVLRNRYGASLNIKFRIRRLTPGANPVAPIVRLTHVPEPAPPCALRLPAVPSPARGRQLSVAAYQDPPDEPQEPYEPPDEPPLLSYTTVPYWPPPGVTRRRSGSGHATSQRYAPLPPENQVALDGLGSLAAAAGSERPPRGHWGHWTSRQGGETGSSADPSRHAPPGSLCFSASLPRAAMVTVQGSVSRARPCRAMTSSKTGMIPKICRIRRGQMMMLMMMTRTRAIPSPAQSAASRSLKTRPAVHPAASTSPLAGPA